MGQWILTVMKYEIESFRRVTRGLVVIRQKGGEVLDNDVLNYIHRK